MKTLLMITALMALSSASAEEIREKRPVTKFRQSKQAEASLSGYRLGLPEQKQKQEDTKSRPKIEEKDEFEPGGRSEVDPEEVR